MWLDIIVALLLISAFIIGCKKGLINEAIEILAVILGIFASLFVSKPMAGWLAHYYGWSLIVCKIISWLLIFLVVAVVLTFIGKMLHRLLEAIHLGKLESLLGGLFVVAEYICVIIIVLFLANLLDGMIHFVDKIPGLNESVVYNLVCGLF